MTDVILVFSIITIWIAVFEAILIMIGAIVFVRKQNKTSITLPKDMSDYPTVTVLVPAHNEAIVIKKTVEYVLRLNYPAHKLQVIVIADNCTDATASEVRSLKANPLFADRNFEVIERQGKGGKSGALNHALAFATGDWICIFDADAAPERNTLAFLMQKALENPDKYGAVFGRNKARNRAQNFLSRSINLELVTAHRVYHTGMWQLFKLGTIPGTNYIIKSELIRDIGGWDEAAITEDIAVSFEVMTRGQLIALAPRAEAYQQEPEKLSVYMRQRERWAKGNYQVIMDNIHHLFNRSSWRIKAQILYYATSFFWYMIAIIISDILFVTNIVYLFLSLFNSSITPPFQYSEEIYVFLIISWALMYYIYVLQINLALASDIGQSTRRNFLLSFISYFTYAQLFLVISVKAFYTIMKEKIFGTRDNKWYKTERFN